ncbi:MAG: hypothetical protein LBQ54_10455 [Planctomycetaceae bacterium]|jgi:hypothetical protein|nr:hypothetical protein [Planctomycetaceae bacterium]
MEEIRDYCAACEYFQKIVDYKGTVTPDIERLKEMAKRSVETARHFCETGTDGRSTFTDIPSAAYWTWKRLVLMIAGFLIILSGVVLKYIEMKRR